MGGKGELRAGGLDRWRTVLVVTLIAGLTGHRVAAQTPSALIAELGCAGCHAGMPARTSTAPPLGPAGARYDDAWIFAYLAHGSPPRPGTLARMPDFRLDPAERVALAAFLSGSGTGPARTADDSQRAAHRAARAANRSVDAALGRRIFVGVNCAGCHTYQGIAPWSAGPDLSTEGSRARPAWLRDFLARPHAVRPYGAYPGSGSRMPDFGLTPTEVTTIATYLAERRTTLPAYTPRPLTPFAQSKATALLRDELSCVGCHQLPGIAGGGRIGPDLSNAGARLDVAWVAAMIRDPRHTVPGTIMPQVAMPASTESLVVAFVATRRSSAPLPPYLSLATHPLLAPTYGDSARELYARTCAGCHGETGRGDGWNARYLPVRPTAHADGRYMSTRADGTLFDGIHGGGRILARSNRMPPFGESLTRPQLWSLVTYIRTLCDCAGPDWSRSRGGAR